MKRQPWVFPENEEAKRRISVAVRIGDVTIGGDSPVVVQSMTNTDTADIAKTGEQIFHLWQAGSEIVRITVDRPEAAKAVPYIRDSLDMRGCNVPLVGDFHYIGHKLLTEYPACARALAKYRINPGNVGFREKRDKQFSSIIEQAIRHDACVRIGVNWGSLDQELLTQLMNDNAQSQSASAEAVVREAMIRSALESAKLAESIGLARNCIVLSCKTSSVSDLICIYRALAARCDYALHLGLTEAGMGTKGVVASAAAMGILLKEGIGDTIRVSLTPDPGGDRAREVQVAAEILQVMGLRSFMPQVAACPGCGRTTSDVFQNLAKKIEEDLKRNMPIWRERYPGVEDLKVAVMGCIVNGPGESKHADIGISLPGTGEQPAAPVFIDGHKVATLRGSHIAEDFQSMLNAYIHRRFGNHLDSETFSS